MTNIKATKRALLSSTLALFLCFAMLLGTTFAWFTDSVTSANNIITAGNLDIRLDYAKEIKDGELDWNEVTGDPVFDTNALWEPGRVEVVYLKVSNIGSLALQYQLRVNINEEVAGINMDGEEFKLSENLVFKVVETKNVSETYTRNEAIAVDVPEQSLVQYNNDATKLDVKGIHYIALIVYMPEDVGNEANYRGDAVPTIDLGINLYATQVIEESDSFDDKYDEGADMIDAILAEGGEIIMAGTHTEKMVVSDGADVTINLGGNTLENNLTNNGDVTIKNGTILSDNNVIVNKSGNIVVENVTLTQKNSKSYMVVGEKETGTMIFNNVNATSTDGGVKIHGGNAIFESGSITMNSESTSSRHVFYVDGASLTINDGDFKFSPNNLTRKGFYVYAANGAQVEILGGTFAAPSTRTGNEDYKNYVTGFYADANSSIVIKGGTFGFNPSKWLADGYKAVQVEKTWVVVAENIDVVSDAKGLAAALTADKKDISVLLMNDIDLPISTLGQITGGSGEYKLGGKDTKAITIDLNDKTLNITTTYWSNLGAKNDNAKFTIKNGSMTSSQATGTWNSYDLTFSNCDYVIENVVFEKAVAFDNAGKNVTLKGVTINEAHDYYALWITATGQNVTIDGLTVNSEGRGIKIDEQYVGTPAKVTLDIKNATFNTAKKAAVMVKSAAGADITVENVDISKVSADKTNVVWVDADAATYADRVKVTGATVVTEK